MKILLTGLTSFTGQYLMPLLRQAKCEVYPLVRQTTGFENELLWDFLGDLPENIPACDAVVHLAADVDFRKDFNCDQYRVNTLATSKLVSYSQANNAYFIFASSVAVHGQETHITAQSLIRPISHYAISKYLAEEIIKDFSRRYAILRIAGIYGLDGPQHLGLNRSINESFYDHKAPTLAGTGEAKRNYICVRDVARWIVHLLGKNALEDSAIGETLYLADNAVMSIKDYLESIVDVLVPEGQLTTVEGGAGSDVVVEASPAPFEMTKFNEYLTLLKSQEYVTP